MRDNPNSIVQVRFYGGPADGLTLPQRRGDRFYRINGIQYRPQVMPDGSSRYAVPSSWQTAWFYGKQLVWETIWAQVVDRQPFIETLVDDVMRPGIEQFVIDINPLARQLAQMVMPVETMPDTQPGEGMVLVTLAQLWLLNPVQVAAALN